MSVLTCKFRLSKPESKKSPRAGGPGLSLTRCGGREAAQHRKTNGPRRHRFLKQSARSIGTTTRKISLSRCFRTVSTSEKRSRCCPCAGAVCSGLHSFPSNSMRQPVSGRGGSPDRLDCISGRAFQHHLSRRQLAAPRRFGMFFAHPTYVGADVTVLVHPGKVRLFGWSA
jgi:hypothetical protein